MLVVSAAWKVAYPGAAMGILAVTNVLLVAPEAEVELLWVYVAE